MARLLINPDTPHAWEILLKPGTHSLGRAEGNDFLIPHPSVSSSHCQITVDDAGVHIRDLGSSNGTFVDRAPVSESRLRPGQRVQLGAVDMVFEDARHGSPSAAPPLVRVVAATPRISINTAPRAEAPEPFQPDESQSAAAAPPIPVRVTATPRVSATQFPAIGETQPSQRQEPRAAAPPPIPRPAAVLSTTALFCKFHPKSPARFLCQKCNKYYCDVCVGTRNETSGTVKFCRTCGSQAVPVQQRLAPQKDRGFYARLPGTFVYPFRGIGPLILFFATIAYAVLSFGGGLFFISVKVMYYGFLFLFMQNILHVTNSDEKETLCFPQATGLGGAAFQLGGTILMSYCVAIGLIVARIFGVDIPAEAIMAAIIFGCLYFPMAFLAVAMKDSVAASNPLVVIPSISKIPLEYLVAAGLMMAIFGVYQLGSLISSEETRVTLTTHDMSKLFMAMGIQAILALVCIYLLTVNMRILGLLYIAKKDKLEWF